MKPKFYTLAFIAISIFFISCKTASKLYEKGDYDEAVALAAKKLQKDPTDAKLLDIIQSSYRYAVDDHESRISTDAESTNELKWEWAYNEYAALQKMYEAIRKVPAINDIIHATDYSSELVNFGEKAGDVRFDRALSFMQHEDKESYRSAYRELQVAIQFKPGDRDVLQKMDEAYEYAVTNVVILPMEQQYGYSFSSYSNVSGQSFQDQMLWSLQNNSGNDFVKFYSAGDASSRNIRADEVVDMRLTSLNIGRYHDDKSKRQVSKDVVIKETTYRPDSVVKEYGKVYADITTTKRSMQSDAMLQVNVRDANGAWLWSDNFTGNNSWGTEFATYTGDARALSESDKQLVSNKGAQPPSDDEIIKCMMDEINNNALYSIKNYFSRF